MGQILCVCRACFLLTVCIDFVIESMLEVLKTCSLIESIAKKKKIYIYIYAFAIIVCLLFECRFVRGPRGQFVSDFWSLGDRL